MDGNQHCRIIMYGEDKVLLKTRKDVLASAGIKTDTAAEAEKFLECIASSDRGYDIFILCSSVYPETKEVIREAAKGSGVEIYSVPDIIEPAPFIEHVRQMATQPYVSAASK